MNLPRILLFLLICISVLGRGTGVGEETPAVGPPPPPPPPPPPQPIASAALSGTASSVSASPLEALLEDHLARNPRERDGVARDLETLKEGVAEEQKRFLIDCVKANVLLKYSFTPGMSRADICKSQVHAAREAKDCIDKIRREYPSAPKHAYFRYLELRVCCDSLGDCPPAGERLACIELAKRLLSDWSVLSLDIGKVPKSLRLATFWTVRDALQMVALEDMPTELSSGDRSVLLESRILTKMQAFGSPPDMIAMQQRAIAIAGKIAEGANPTIPLCEQIDREIAERAGKAEAGILPAEQKKTKHIPQPDPVRTDDSADVYGAWRGLIIAGFALVLLSAGMILLMRRLGRKPK